MLVMRAIMYFNPLRIFLPLCIFLLTVGGSKAIYDIFAYSFHFAPSTVMLILTGVQLGAMGPAGRSDRAPEPVVKLLWITSSYPRYAGDGAGSFIASLARALVAPGA